MPACYFNSDFESVYSCEYKLIDGHIEIEVDGYDIMDEVESINGMKVYGSNTEFAVRDIMIIDYHAKKNYQAKRAYYAGHAETMGTLDGGVKSKFRASVFFEHGELDKLKALLPTPKANKIRMYSKSIIDWIGYPSLTNIKTDSALTYTLSREYEGASTSVESNQIKQITVSDYWNATRSIHQYDINIDFKGYIELELMKRVNYDEVYEFIYELLIFMQLYCPDRFKIDEIWVMVNDTYYGLHLPLPEIKYKESRAQQTVEVDLLEFLKECYLKIPYRKGKAEIRNIPYIVLKTSRGLEDNFLMFYRFIECYYKKAGINKFISSSITEHYVSKHHLTDEQLENYTQEIICLRNHYVHAGYYIENASLRVSFEKIDEEENPKNYTVNNVDAHWVYERTKILYQVVIDIIYKNMLGYDNYHFSRHF